MSAWRSGIAVAGSAVALVALTAALPTGAHAATPDPQPYRYMAVLHGECQELVLAGRDQSASCNGELVNVDFGDGRVAFVFTSPSERGTTVTTFLGRASRQNDLRDYRLEVDALSTAVSDGHGAPAIVDEAAVGHCQMIGDPVRERARFECAVEPAEGRKTTARFVSAGTPSVYAGTRGGTDATVTAER